MSGNYQLQATADKNSETKTNKQADKQTKNITKNLFISLVSRGSHTNESQVRTPRRSHFGRRIRRLVVVTRSAFGMALPLGIGRDMFGCAFLDDRRRCNT